MDDYDDDYYDNGGTEFDYDPYYDDPEIETLEDRY